MMRNSYIVSNEGSAEINKAMDNSSFLRGDEKNGGEEEAKGK